MGPLNMTAAKQPIQVLGIASQSVSHYLHYYKVKLTFHSLRQFKTQLKNVPKEKGLCTNHTPCCRQHQGVCPLPVMLRCKTMTSPDATQFYHGHNKDVININKT